MDLVAIVGTSDDGITMATAVGQPRSVSDGGEWRYRRWAWILAFGAAFMFGRTAQMVWQGSLLVFVPWVGGLLLLELTMNAVTLLATLRWALGPDPRRRRFALRAVAGTVLVHATRVLVFVLGRTGPWVDFDIRPERQSEHAAEVSWVSVWFAAGMAITSLVVLVSVWVIARRRRLG